jgi:hypothetical protein
MILPSDAVAALRIDLNGEVNASGVGRHHLPGPGDGGPGQGRPEPSKKSFDDSNTVDSNTVI